MASLYRSINALILREIKSRVGNNPLSLLWVFIEPILHVGVLIAIKSALNINLVQNIDNMLFVISGIVPYFAFQNALQSCMTGPRSNQALLAFPEIKTHHIIISRILFEYIIMLFTLIFLLTGAYALGHHFQLNDVLMFFLFYTEIVLLGAGVGLIFSPLAGRYHFIEMMVNMTKRILYFTSGVFFTLDYLPYNIQLIMSWNPIAHILTLLRGSLFEDFIPNSLHNDHAFVAIVVVVLLYFGLYMIRKFESWAYESPH